jgi:hypothetical protein
MVNKVIRLVLAFLFFACLLKMPYGFYNIVRFIALIGFAILAYQASEKINKTEMIIYLGLALLFQPLFKITLGRQNWNIIDVFVGLGLILSIFLKQKKSQE